MADLMQPDFRYYTAAGAGSIAGGAVMVFDGGLTAAAGAAVLVMVAAIGVPSEEERLPVQLFAVRDLGDAAKGADKGDNPMEAYDIGGLPLAGHDLENWISDEDCNGGLNQVRIAFHQNVHYYPTLALERGPRAGSETWANLVFCVSDVICVAMYTGDPQAAKEEAMLGDVGNLAVEMEINPPGNTPLMEHTVIGCLAPNPSAGDWPGPTIDKPNICAIGDVPEIDEERMVRVRAMPNDPQAQAFDEALDRGGCGLFLVPIRFYSPEKPANFWEIQGAARMMSQVAVGYYKDGNVIVNPTHADKDTAIIWAEGDYVLVVDMVDE